VMMVQIAIADICVTGQRVKCGSCSAILAVPQSVARFACSICGAVLRAPGGSGDDAIHMEQKTSNGGVTLADVFFNKNKRNLRTKIVRTIAYFASVHQTFRLLLTCKEMLAAEEKIFQGYSLPTVCNMKRSDGLKMYRLMVGTHVAPLWVQDIASTKCQLCSQSFTFFVRRHHCRNCGFLVCNDCSLNRARIPTETKAVRVCDPCLVQMKHGGGVESRWLMWLATSKVKELMLPTCMTEAEMLIVFGGGRFSGLRTLDLYGGVGDSPITDASLTEVGRRCSNLQSLDLTFCENIIDTGLAEVARGCPNLHNLNLGWCRNITEASLVEVGRRCSNLQSLDLAYCLNITDTGLSAVARGCPNLQTLNIQSCFLITEASLSEVGRRCSNLQSLDLDDCENITDTGLSAVARGCPNLQTLNIKSCYNITDASLSEVGRRCSNLQSLDVSWCQITDTGLSAVARGCSNLQSLMPGGCRNITDASLLEVAKGCSNLQTLELSYCRNITDASVLEVARRCSNLQLLNLESCGNITDASVMEVARGCSNLRTLYLSECTNITDVSVLEVARGCSNLQSLDLRGCFRITSACKNVLRQLHSKSCLPVLRFGWENNET